MMVWTKVLRRLRVELGLTQKQAAAKFGVTQGAWGMWELGTRKPRIGKQKELRDFMESRKR